MPLSEITHYAFSPYCFVVKVLHDDDQFWYTWNNVTWRLRNYWAIPQWSSWAYAKLLFSYGYGFPTLLLIPLIRSLWNASFTLFTQYYFWGWKLVHVPASWLHIFHVDQSIESSCSFRCWCLTSTWFRSVRTWH